MIIQILTFINLLYPTALLNELNIYTHIFLMFLLKKQNMLQYLALIGDF